ncbi:MAG: putative metal-binding motif-containing protein [archaeon]
MRTFSKTEVNVDGELTVYLHVYPACYESYSISEIVPSGWTILDRGEGSGSMDSVTWAAGCSGVCESRVFSYKVRAPSSAIMGEFVGQFRMPYGGTPATILSDNYIQVSDVTCTTGGACADQEACQGEYCDAGHTQSCFDFQCVNSCTGREGYYCGSCEIGDVSYPAGNLGCGGGDFCCQEMPSQTCEEIGGYCILDEVLPMQECPPGFSENSYYNIKCNDGFEIPLRGEPYPICCMPPGMGSCADGDGDGYGVCPNCGVANGCDYEGDDCDDADQFEYPSQSWYEDRDNDDYADDSSIVSACLNPGGAYIPSEQRQGPDCDDYNSMISPVSSETCDRRDNDCNGIVDNGCVATDCDSLLVKQCSPGSPGASWKVYAPGNSDCSLDQYCYILNGPTCGEVLGAEGCMSAGCLGGQYVHLGDDDCRAQMDSYDSFCCAMLG